MSYPQLTYAKRYLIARFHQNGKSTGEMTKNWAATHLLNHRPEKLGASNNRSCFSTSSSVSLLLNFEVESAFLYESVIQGDIVKSDESISLQLMGNSLVY